MALIYAHKSRGLTKDLTITKADGSTITPGANDKIRAIIARVGKSTTDAKLTITSDAATANGSSFTKNGGGGGKNRLRLDASDLALIPAGTYTLIIDLFDNADAQEWKTISRQILFLEST